MKINAVQSPRTIFQEAAAVQSRAVTSQTASTLSSAGQGAPRKASIGSTICGVIAGCCVCALGCLVAIFHCVTCGIFLPRKNPALEKAQNDLEKLRKDSEVQLREGAIKAKKLDASYQQEHARLLETRAKGETYVSALNAKLQEEQKEVLKRIREIKADCLAEGSTPAAQEKMKKRMNELKAEMAAKRKEILGEAPSQPQAAS